MAARGRGDGDGHGDNGQMRKARGQAGSSESSPKPSLRLSTSAAELFTGAWRSIGRERRGCQAGRLVGCEGTGQYGMGSSISTALLGRYDEAVGPDQADRRSRTDGRRGRREAMGSRRGPARCRQ
jgi:hypothetical protein